MASLNMNGPFELKDEVIDAKVDKNWKNGNYAYGRKDSYGTFVLDYVGRSDTNLCNEIKSRKTNPKFKNCTHFKFSYASSEKEAFEKECKNYHEFKPRLNDMHPDKPDGKEYKCPVEGCLKHK